MSKEVFSTKEEIIQRIKDCGQSIINNAENIANDYKYGTFDLEIIIRNISRYDEYPIIEVSRQFIPETIIKRYTEKGE